jgi:TonB-dependent starch-binding outer membrane protein SusC
MRMRKLLAAIVMLLLSAAQLSAQSTRTITGKVTDEKGVPLSGVSVKAGNVGATTAGDGTYSLKVPSNAKQLSFAYVGYLSMNKNISGNILNTSLVPEEKSLSEVVVVGYGTQKKKESTGNVVSIKGDAVAQKPVQSFESALAGRAAGVQITIPNGVVNNPPVFRIRGTNSISLSSYPLIIVDGVPTYTGDVSGTNASGNALASINPNDIESIDIAKDAAATSIYGSRAANGVVFITTKKGKAGKAKVSFDTWFGWTEAYGLPKLLDAFQYTDIKNEAVNNNPSQLASLGANPFKLTMDANGQPINTNWYNYVYRRGLSQSHSVGVSGGNDATTYYLGVGYSNQQGIIKSNEFIRKNILFNIDSRLNKTFTIGGKISFSNEQNNLATTSGSLNGEAFSSAGIGRLPLVNSPNVSPYKNDGSYNIVIRTTPPSTADQIGVMNNAVAQVGFLNPVVLLDKNRSNSEGNHIQSNVYIQVKPVNWMTLKTMYAIDYLNVDNDLFWNPLHGDGQIYGGYATASFAKNKTSLWTNTAQFDYAFDGRHNTSLLIGNEQQRRTFIGFGLNRQTLSDPIYDVIQAGFTTNNTAGLGYGENYLLSNFGRLNYDFAKKYFLSGTLRQDEYSGLGQKRGVFWGASAGWEITKEKFWEDAGLSKIFSNMRIRGSYGKVGNVAGIGDYSPYSTYGSGLYGGNSTLALGSVGNPDLKWETSKKTDIGIVMSFLNNRLGTEITYYHNDINELILGVPQASSTGLGSVTANVGKMYNRGLEISINATPIQKAELTWTSSLNLTFNKNLVTELAPGLKEITYATSGNELTNKTMAGYSLGYLFVVETPGVDPGTGRRILLNSQGRQVLYQFYAPAGQFNFSNPDGTQYYFDPVAKSGTSITQAADGVMYANSQPKQYGGWDNTFKYRNFDLNVLFTYQAGFYVYYGTGAGLLDQRFWNNSVDVLNRWKKPGDVTNVPRIVYGDNVSNGSGLQMSSNVYKGDFVKLRTVSFGYTLPRNVINKFKLTNARFYVSGQNLALFTKYPGPDPEVSSNGNSTQGQGVDRNSVGNARTITIGLNVSF